MKKLIFIKNTKAATVIESLVAIGLVGFFVVIFSSTYTIVAMNAHLKHKSLAYNLVSEEIEALRSIPYSQLSNRENSDFIEVGYNQGNWAVQSFVSAPSSQNVFELTSPTGNPSGITGVSILPGFEYDDFTFELDFYIHSDSPSGWKTGSYLRYHDENNFYRIAIDQSNIVVNKKVNGTTSSINSEAKNFQTNTWYTLKVIVNDLTLNIYIDDILELTAVDNDHSFTDGKIALLGEDSVHANFDDVSVSNGSTQSWNFDSDSSGLVPDTWKRFGLYDLSFAISKLTIADYQGTYSDIKEITASIEWQEKGNTRIVKIQTLITK